MSNHLNEKSGKYFLAIKKLMAKECAGIWNDLMAGFKSSNISPAVSP